MHSLALLREPRALQHRAAQLINRLAPNFVSQSLVHKAACSQHQAKQDPTWRVDCVSRGVAESDDRHAFRVDLGLDVIRRHDGYQAVRTGQIEPTTCIYIRRVLI